MDLLKINIMTENIKLLAEKEFFMLAAYQGRTFRFNIKHETVKKFLTINKIPKKLVKNMSETTIASMCNDLLFLNRKIAELEITGNKVNGIKIIN